MCVCLHHIIKKEEKVPLLTDIPTPTCTQSHLDEAKAVPLVLTQTWRFFFSTKLRKWGGVHFTGMCFCASVSTHTLHLQGCVLFFFPIHIQLFAQKLVWPHFLEVASAPHPRGCSSRCMAPSTPAKTLQTGIYLLNSCMLYILCSHPSSICVGDFSEVEYFHTFLGIKMKSDHFGVWLPTDAMEEKWLLSNLSQPGRLHLVLQLFVMVTTKFTVTW